MRLETWLSCWGMGMERLPAKEKSTAPGGFYQFPAVADFNGDGIPDLVTTSDEGGVNFLRGNGDGTFTFIATREGVVFASSITVADFNGDGIPDIAASNGSQVTILLGKGDGTFTVKATLKEPALQGIGDFNDDGIPDLAVAGFNPDSSGAVTVLLGKGDGTFSPGATFNVLGSFQSATVGDFSGDGLSDLAVDFDPNDDTSPGTVSVFLAGIATIATAMDVAVPGTGTHFLVASYPGDSNHLASTSSALPVAAGPR